MTILLGDARMLLPRSVDGPAVVITDPVWPNAPQGLFDVDDPVSLLAQVLELCQWARRVIVILGCESDPRFLAAVPPRVPFVRKCWLRYACPVQKGTILNGSDVAYVFGSNLTVRPRRLLPGEVTANSPEPRRFEAGEHPTPRRLEHMLWLVDHYTAPDDLVVDPFCGSGTTLVAAARFGRRFWGCDVDPRWVALSRERVLAEEHGHSLAQERSGQLSLTGRE